MTFVFLLIKEYHMNNYTHYIQQFNNYQWLLRTLNTKNSEYRIISSHIAQGLASQDTLKPDWEDEINREISQLRDKLKQIEDIIISIPDTADLIPCKLFLRLYYIIGCSLTETASEMNISLSTLRRIRKRCANYFDDFPKI